MAIINYNPTKIEYFSNLISFFKNSNFIPSTIIKLTPFITVFPSKRRDFPFKKAEGENMDAPKGVEEGKSGLRVCCFCEHRPFWENWIIIKRKLKWKGGMGASLVSLYGKMFNTHFPIPSAANPLFCFHFPAKYSLIFYRLGQLTKIRAE